jgi:hypothetical protein
LLEQLGRGEPSRLAAAAALGLDPVNGVPSDLHPFARAMVLASLYDAGLRIRQGW